MFMMNITNAVCKDSQKSDLTLAKVDDMMASPAKMLVDDSNKEPWLDSNYVPRVLTDDYKPNGKDEALSRGFEKAVKKLQKGIALDEEDKPFVESMKIPPAAAVATAVALDSDESKGEDEVPMSPITASIQALKKQCVEMLKCAR